MNGATAEQKQCQCKETKAHSYALALILRSTVGTESLPFTVLQLEQKKPTYFHRSVCNSLLSYFIWTQKANLFHMLDSGSQYGFPHKECIISEMQLTK